MRSAIVGLMSASLCMPAWAADLPPPVSVAVTSYFWATAIDAKSAPLPPLPAAHASLSFRDVLEELNGAVMAAADVRVDRLGFLVDGQFSQVTADGTLPGPLASSLKLRSRSITVQAAALYRVYEDATTSVEAAAGLRFWNLNNKLEIASGGGTRRIEHSQTETWVDPTIGVRLGLNLGDPWSLTVAGDVGGFGVGSRFSWQALATANYALNENWTMRVGYRALHVDYRSGGYLYDATLHGPAVAATYRF